MTEVFGQESLNEPGVDPEIRLEEEIDSGLDGDELLFCRNLDEAKNSDDLQSSIDGNLTSAPFDQSGGGLPAVRSREKSLQPLRYQAWVWDDVCGGLNCQPRRRLGGPSLNSHW